MPTNANNCPTSLEDLNRPLPCEKSAGGLVTEVLYALKSDVASWPAKATGNTIGGFSDHIETLSSSTMSMSSGKRMFKIQTKKDSAEIKYTLQGESGSRSFKATLEIFSPVVRAALLGFITATANQELVLLCKTRTGDWHLLGDEDEGVEYESAEATTGKTGTDANGATLVLSTNCAAPTIYKGDNIADLTTLPQ